MNRLELDLPISVKSYARYSDSKHPSANIYTCPLCGGGNLHPETLCVDNIRIPVGPGSLVQIVCWCEVCDQTHALTVSHHKGQTFIVPQLHNITDPVGRACHGA
jgi:hypothetical protein